MRRQHFGLLIISLMVLSIALIGLTIFPTIWPLLKGGGEPDEAELQEAIMGNIGLVVLVVALYIPIFIISLLAQARRFQDMGHPGWWALVTLVVSFIPIVGGAISILVLFFLFLYPGTNGPNKYGPDPKNPQLTDMQPAPFGA